MADGVAVEVREWLSNHNGYHDQGDQEESVDDCGDEVGEEIVEEEDNCNGAVEDGNADLKLIISIHNRGISIGRSWNLPH